MTESELKELFREQKLASRKGIPDFEQRIQALKTLSDTVEANKDRLIQSVYEDFGLRSREESLILEIFPLQDQIRHAIKHLRSWMKRRRVPSSWFLLPSKAYFQYQPLGVVGIMGAWNYQILLSLSPLVDAIAAGNHALIKPSEIAPRSAEVIKEIINKAFPKDFIHCVTGNADTAKNFSSIPFDHLFFTGSTRVGKLIMEAAAKNLTPVTLELGGKSPAVIHSSYSVKRAAKRIMTGKLFNAGQTCVAADYVILPRALNADFKEAVKSAVSKFYPNLGMDEQYSHIINDEHLKRLRAILEDAREKGATIIELSDKNNSDNGRIMTPKLVFNVNEEMQVMKEEIFGPILPVVNLETTEETIDYINERPKPLALYYFDTNKKRIDKLIQNTISGGVCVNDTIYHLAQHNLPFGGVGASGMGHYHGYDGFKTFSKKRPVMQQRDLATSDFLRPPFTGFKQKLIKVMGRFSKV